METLLLIRDGISEQPALPENSHITLAIGRDVPWAFVSTLLNRLDEADKQTTILVGNKHRVHAMVLDDKLKNRASDGSHCNGGRQSMRPASKGSGRKMLPEHRCKARKPNGRASDGSRS